MARPVAMETEAEATAAPQGAADVRAVDGETIFGEEQ